MSEYIPLSYLGDRIRVTGLSNSGESTLANAISKKTALPVVHLDQLRHVAGTDWLPREKEKFVRLHADAVAGDQWIIEGTASRSPRRHARQS